jgi:hypothetical protein
MTKHALKAHHFQIAPYMEYDFRKLDNNVRNPFCKYTKNKHFGSKVERLVGQMQM